MILRRVLALGLVGCVAACGIELSSVPGNEGTDKTASSSSSSSSGASSSSSSSGASSGSSSGDASTVVDAAPDVPKVPPPQYKWRCTAVTDGMAKFNPSVGGSVAATALCTADHLAKCAGIGFRPDSDCGKLGDTTRTCVPLCALNGEEASYTWDNVCTCGL